jgi:hypothetical protein
MNFANRAVVKALAEFGFREAVIGHDEAYGDALGVRHGARREDGRRGEGNVGAVCLNRVVGRQLNHDRAHRVGEPQDCAVATFHAPQTRERGDLRVKPGFKLDRTCAHYSRSSLMGKEPMDPALGWSSSKSNLSVSNRTGVSNSHVAVTIAPSAGATSSTTTPSGLSV